LEALVEVLDEGFDGVFDLLGGTVNSAPAMFSVSRANQRSTRLSHEAELGVTCRWKRGRLASQLRIVCVL
jgi:hypothetical protein